MSKKEDRECKNILLFMFCYLLHAMLDMYLGLFSYEYIWDMSQNYNFVQAYLEKGALSPQPEESKQEVG